MEPSRQISHVMSFRAVLPALLAAFLCGGATAVSAQQDMTAFPSAAANFLGGELPEMEAAIEARDRDYFESAMVRMLDFSESWGFRSRDNPALERYPMCTEAVSDFLVVGMCRIMTTSDTCEPGLATRFNSNLKQCRELATRR